MTIRRDPSLMGHDERWEYYRELADELKERRKDDFLHGRTEEGDETEDD